MKFASKHIIKNGYIVTSCGNVFSLKSNKWLSLFKNKDGYNKVNLNINGKKVQFQVHRLVAMRFLSSYKHSLTVDHINFI